MDDDELVGRTAHRICAFANGQCDCRKRNQRPCQSVASVASVIIHETTEGLRATFRLSRKAQQKPRKP
jgi:hypothetical protein